MKEYHKIQTVYLRDLDSKSKSLIEGSWSKPEFNILQDIDWICTEKIDGTNIRVMWDGIKVRFGGRTNNAQIPSHLIEVLIDLFPNEKMEKIFPLQEGLEPGESNVCLYGEGYGRKIQKGGNYLPNDVNFILFDIKIGNWWLKRNAIEEIASQLDIPIVPIIGVMKLKEAIEYVKKGFKSTIAHNKDYDAEGLIAKPVIELFNRRGDRIITKIKTKDFKK